ncbi:MAG: bifunctional nuclease family protein [Opitutales bacterium]|nr:bifunctional nuclease family protein [Opitutales bacterium]MCH8541546.1 bifunctional nuclease family protein [Opitutales bacterium]
MAAKALFLLLTSALVFFTACKAENNPTPSSPSPENPSQHLVDAETIENKDLVPAEIATVGMDHLSGAPIVLLRDLQEGRPVPIWIGIAEAQAILRGMHEVHMPRPMTHDLLAGIIAETGYEVTSIAVHSLEQGTYLGALTLKHRETGEEKTIDSRPSDALALAIRTDAKILVAKEILLAEPDFEFVPPPTGEQVVRVAGLTLVSRDTEFAAEHGLERDEPLVKVRRSTGFAAEFDIREDDIILRAGDQEMTSPNDFFRLYLGIEEDEYLPIILWRDGTEIELNLPRDDEGSGEGIEI